MTFLKCSLLVLLFGTFAVAIEEELPIKRWFIEAEAGPVWQSRNEVQIPGNSGTRFSLKDFGSGPFLAGRLYAGFHWTKKSDFRILAAPLSITGRKTLDSSISFQGQTFTPGSEVMSFYKFDSYRFTYRYLILDSEQWKLWLGFTGKIREAEISLSQGTNKASKTDLGFVPLLHFKVQFLMAENWFLEADADALAAPQGRAEDLVMRVVYQLNPRMRANIGYRLLEGGADNNSVYTFAFLHYGVIGLQVEF